MPCFLDIFLDVMRCFCSAPMHARSASSVTFFAPLRNCPPRQAKEGERNGRKNENSPPLLLLSALCFFLPFSLLLARQVDANRFHSPPRSNPCELISKLTLTWQEASLHPELWIYRVEQKIPARFVWWGKFQWGWWAVHLLPEGSE